MAWFQSFLFHFFSQCSVQLRHYVAVSCVRFISLSVQLLRLCVSHVSMLGSFFFFFCSVILHFCFLTCWWTFSCFQPAFLCEVSINICICLCVGFCSHFFRVKWGGAIRSFHDWMYNFIRSYHIFPKWLLSLRLLKSVYWVWLIALHTCSSFLSLGLLCILIPHCVLICISL